MSMGSNDRETLRLLATQVREIAELPIQQERIRLWKKHNGLQPERPMILVFPEGSWSELIPNDSLQCVGERERKVEFALRRRIYQHERISDDLPIEGEWLVPKRLRNTGWGLAPKWDSSNRHKGAKAYHPVILDAADLKQLRFPKIAVDEERTLEDSRYFETLLGDILDVRVTGVKTISFHLMSRYCALRGLEQVMTDMMMAPEMLHEAMSFFEEGHRKLIQQYAALGLLELNSDGSYQNSGGVSYTDELPQQGCDPGRPRLCDLWGSAEAQELTGVSPEMHEEFCLAYERRLLAPFGLTGYGCCEDLTRKFDMTLTIPNLRRLSVSPFTDVEVAAASIQDKCIFSWKPQPMHLVGAFNEERVRRYIRATVDAARGCVLEIVLKDTHTCESHPERFTRWVEIARDEVERA